MGKREKIFDLVEAALHEDSAELYDIKDIRAGAHSVLRIFITKEGGVAITDCERVSRIVDPIIEESGVLSGKYTLEVSSPGLDRTLTDVRHFATAIEENVRIRFKTENDKVSTVAGVLKSADEISVSIDINNEIKEIPFSDILSGKIII